MEEHFSDPEISITALAESLELSTTRFSLSFKWADNPTLPGDIISVSTTGDTAPNRRFAYRFVWER